jgi:hypothetical protein
MKSSIDASLPRMAHNHYSLRGELEFCWEVPLKHVEFNLEGFHFGSALGWTVALSSNIFGTSAT